MEFVKHDKPDAFCPGVRKQLPDKNTVSLEYEPCTGTDARIEPDLVSDLLSALFADESRAVGGKASRRDSSRLQDDDGPIDASGIEKKARDARGLPTARRRGDNQTSRSP
jgi:hypothetical protein